MPLRCSRTGVASLSSSVVGFSVTLVLLLVSPPGVEAGAQHPSKSKYYLDRAVYDEATAVEESGGASNCDGLWIRPLNRTNQSPRHRCLCNATHISCINLQMTPPPPGGHRDPHQKQAAEPPDYFMELDDSKFENIETITIHGNNLENLPTRLFGQGDAHRKLKHLNLSSNYFIGVNSQAFRQDLDSLETLDLSDNEIILTQAGTKIFHGLPSLRELYLRRSFNHYRSEEILPLLDKALRTAKLHKLETLVLSGNNFRKIPKDLGCYLPNLRSLQFRWNSVSKWDVISNETCFSKLKVLDLSHFNRVTVMNRHFMDFVNNLPADTKIILSNLRLKANGELVEFVEWLNETIGERSLFVGHTVVRYKNSATQPLRDVLNLRLETVRHQIDHPPSAAKRHFSPSAMVSLLIAGGFCLLFSHDFQFFNFN